MEFIKRLDQGLARGEQGLLVLVVLLMVGMAVLQIVLRNGFGFGIIWAEPLVRMLVLWSALIGALQAARNNEHIRIDVLMPMLPEKWKTVVARVGNLFAGCICLVGAYYAADFVLIEKQYGSTSFADVPLWICASIMPIGLALIGVRYLLHTLILPPEHHAGVES